MAETIIAIGASVAAGVGSAATSVSSMFGAGAAGGAAAAGGASTLSNVLSVGSALMSIGSGFSQARAASRAAAQSDVQASQIKAQGAQRNATLAKEYEHMVADQAAVTIASGLNPSVGTPASIREATTKIAEQNISVSRSNTANQFAAQRSRSRSLMSQGRSALIGGFMGAGETLLSQAQLTG